MHIKTINFILLSFFIFSCSSKIQDNLNQSYYLKIETPKNRYSTLLNFELQKYNKFNNNHENVFLLEADINFSSQDTLALKGLTPLYKMTGIVSYKLARNDKIVKKGTISSITNYGSVSSLYGREENEKFIKQRIVKNLSLKLLSQIKLIISKIEN